MVMVMAGLCAPDGKLRAPVGSYVDGALRILFF